MYLVGLTALLTAYYMTRQVIMVFFGEARWKDKADEHGAHGDVKPHESPWVMLGPLVVLAVLSTIGGFIQPAVQRDHRSARALAPSVVEPAEGIGEVNIDGTWADDYKYLSAIALAVAIAGIIAAYLVYQRKRVKAIEPAILANAWYYDQASPSSWVGRAASRSRRRRGSTPTSSTAPSTARPGPCASAPAVSHPERLRPRQRRRHRRRRRPRAAWLVVVQGIL